MVKGSELPPEDSSDTWAAAMLEKLKAWKKKMDNAKPEEEGFIMETCLLLKELTLTHIVQKLEDPNLSWAHHGHRE